MITLQYFEDGVSLDNKPCNKVFAEGNLGLTIVYTAWIPSAIQSGVFLLMLLVPIKMKAVSHKGRMI